VVVGPGWATTFERNWTGEPFRRGRSAGRHTATQVRSLEAAPWNRTRHGAFVPRRRLLVGSAEPRER
jgi:hypothetical protein